MKIREITSTHNNDFRAVMVCEHCESTQQLNTGYNDSYYHSRVIPAMVCVTCGKDRAGEVTPEKSDAVVGGETSCPN